MIHGVQVHSVLRIPGERRSLHRKLVWSEPLFMQFGEIRFSTIYPGVKKGWRRPAKLTLNYDHIFGRIKLVLDDEGERSPSGRELMGLFLGRDNLSVVVFLPAVWDGFKGMSTPHAIVVNCATLPHHPKRSAKFDTSTNHIRNGWTLKHC